jgi:hypothetical protein
LAQSQGVEVAEGYAQERWNSGQLCGGGWNCPLPQKVRQELEEAREERKKKYKEEYEKKRRENYEKKYSV